MDTTIDNIDEVVSLILTGNAPSGMRFNGHLDLTGRGAIHNLPDNLTVKRLTLDGCHNLETLPAGLSCYELSARDSGLQTIPADLRVEYKLDLSDCLALRSLPDGLKVGSLVLHNCTVLATLPDNLSAYFLDLSGCTKIITVPESASIRIGRLNLRGCTSLRSLPATSLSQLDVSGCVNLAALPDGMQISSWLDVANTPLTELPPSLQSARLRWRDVFVNERIVFHPETLTAHEILAEPNAELRRIMLDRKGYEAFIGEINAETLHEDSDPGGSRRLLRVPLAGDEPLVCLAVFCPSTTRQYLLRVPPTIRNCHHAAAWIAGFDNPDDYQPLIET